MKHVFSLLVAAVILSLPIHSSAQTSAEKADSLLHFIQTNKDRSSIFLIKNDTIMASLNENKMMPLASTMKIMVAIEFAKQAAFRVFDTTKMVGLNELNNYYLPLTDGNAHPQWLNYEKDLGHIKGDSIALIHVARGMMLFSSNANTEYLMDLLGLQNINGNYRLLSIKDFTPLYYPVSSLFLYQNPRKTKEEKVLKEIAGLSEENYRNASMAIHDQLKINPEYKGQFKVTDLTVPMQKEWSNRLPASTTKSYAMIMRILNNRAIFGDATYLMLKKVLETVMEVPGNEDWLDHAGMKGGSTMFVLTKSLYATLKLNDKIAMAYFFDDLTPGEQAKLQTWMNDFEIEIMTNPAFVNKMNF